MRAVPGEPVLRVIILSVMVSPGVWEDNTLEYKTYDECHKVIHFLRDYNSVRARPWHQWHQYLLTPSEGSGYTFIDNCRSNK